MLQINAVPSGTLDILKEIAAQPCMENFRLVGGTALALQIGHRLSYDLDFFSERKNDLIHIENELLKLPDISLKNRASYVLFMMMKGVKIDIMNYPYEFISPAIELEHIKLAHTDDIAAMKLKTIMNRGAKRDFYDIVFLLKRYSLKEMFLLFEKKYGNIEPMAIYHSLLYFEDAEKQENPVLLKNISLTWEKVKQAIITETRKLF